MDKRNEIKSYIVRDGMTMSEVVERLADDCGWSSSVPNLSGKLRRDSLRYREAVELADVLGYDLVWQKHKGGNIEKKIYAYNRVSTGERNEDRQLDCSYTIFSLVPIVKQRKYSQKWNSKNNISVL